jgi:broad specificity phosphatase PhoE
MPTRAGLVMVLLVLTPGACAPAPGEGAKSYPARVLIIRHAEKPAVGDGLTELGEQRALALPRLFKKADGRPEPFPTPDFIIAASDTKRSRRPSRTVAPLAKELGLKVNTAYGNGDFAKLARDLLRDPKYAGKTVLICWHQGTIPDLARKLKAADAPANWKAGVFDRVWRIDYDEDGQATMRNLPQRLLDGDAAK